MSATDINKLQQLADAKTGDPHLDQMKNAVVKEKVTQLLTVKD